MPRPGWLERQYENAKEDIRNWPMWMRTDLHKVASAKRKVAWVDTRQGQAQKEPSKKSAAS